MILRYAQDDSVARQDDSVVRTVKQDKRRKRREPGGPIGKNPHP